MRNNKFSLTNFTETRLFVYMTIVILCALATILNLCIEHVGFQSLSSNATDEKKLFLLSMGILLVCGISVVCLVLAIYQKRKQERLEEEKRMKKKADKLARKQDKKRK